MIRSGEGRGGRRPGGGRGGEWRGEEGGPRRRPGLHARARRLPGRLAAPRARADCGPGSARGLCASAPGAPRFRSVRPQPRPRRGRGEGEGAGAATAAATARGPGKPTPARPARALTFIPGELAGHLPATGCARPRVYTVLGRAREPPSPENAHGGRGGGWGRGRLRAPDISGMPAASPESGMPLRLTP